MNCPMADLCFNAFVLLNHGPCPFCCLYCSPAEGTMEYWKCEALRNLGGCLSHLGWGRKGPCPGSPLFSGNFLPYSFPEAASLPSSRALSHWKLWNELCCKSVLCEFEYWQPVFPGTHLLDNIHINSSDKPTVQAGQKSKGHLEANDPCKEANPVPSLTLAMRPSLA